MPISPVISSTSSLLALSGGGFKAMAADAGMFAGVMQYYGIDVATLLHDDLAISANSGSTWFANLLAYSNSFVDSLNDYKRLFSTDVNLDDIVVGGGDGFFGVMGEAYNRYLLGYLSGDGLQRLLATVDTVPKFLSFLTGGPGNYARILAACALDGGAALISFLDQKLTGKFGYDTLKSALLDLGTALRVPEATPYIGAMTVVLIEGIDWNTFMQRVVFAPDQVDRLLQATNFYGGDGRTSSLATQSLIYELAISSDEATVAPRSGNSNDGVVHVSVKNREVEYGGLLTKIYNFLPATATSLGNASQRPAPWLPSIGSGSLSVEYDSPAWFDSQTRTYNRLDFQGLSAFLASSISSSAAALAQSLGVINDIDSALGLFVRAVDLLADADVSTVLATFSKGLAPLVQARRRGDGTWSAGDPNYAPNNFADPISTINTADAANSAFLRMADGGYFDNSSVTSGLSYLAANQGHWRANDGIKDFDVTLFVFSGIGEQISTTLQQRGFAPIGDVAERLFTGGSPQEFNQFGIELIDVSHPSSAVFDSTLTSGMASPVWSYKAPLTLSGAAKGFEIQAYDMYTTTVGNNNMNIAGGYEGTVRLWNIISPTGPIPLATGGSWGDYEVMYKQIIDALQTRNLDGIAGAQLLASQLKVEGAPTAIQLSNSVANKDTPSGTTIGVLTTSDPNPGDTFTYQLVGGKGAADNGFFSVVGNQLLASAKLAYDNRTRYSIRVRAVDSRGLWTEEEFIIQQPSVQAGPIRGAKILFDQRSYGGGNLLANCNLQVDAAELVASSDDLGQFSFEQLPDPLIIGNQDGILDWKDGMVIGGAPGSDGRIQLMDSIAGVELGIPMVGLPGQILSILSTLKYAALLRWRPDFKLFGQPLTPQLITSRLAAIIRDVPRGMLDDSYNPYARLFDDQPVERREAVDSLVFAYANLAVIKTVIELFKQLQLDYTSPAALDIWGYQPDALRADRPEIIAFSSYGLAIARRFGTSLSATEDDPTPRQPFAGQYDLNDPSHLRTVLKELLAQIPLQAVLMAAANEPAVLAALRQQENGEQARLVDQFLERQFAPLLNKLSAGLKQIVDVVGSRLREAAAMNEEVLLASIAGSKRTMVETLAAQLVQLSADASLPTVASFREAFDPLFFKPLTVDAVDRAVDDWLSISTAPAVNSAHLRLPLQQAPDPQRLFFYINLRSLQGQPALAPDSGLSVRFRVGGTAVEGVDYRLGQELADRVLWVAPGSSQLRLPLEILNPHLSHQGRTLQFQLLSSDSGFGVDLQQCVVHVELMGDREPIASVPSSGAAATFVPSLMVDGADAMGLLRASGREAANAVLAGRDGVKDQFLLIRPRLGAGLPHVSNFDPEDGDELLIDPDAFPGGAITDFNTYGGLVYHLPSGTPMALVSDLGSNGADQAWGALSSYGGYFRFAPLQPALLRTLPEGILISAAEQSLLFQASTPVSTSIAIGIGDASTRLTGDAAQPKAWTSALAQQALQATLDPELVRSQDGFRQGSSREEVLAQEAVLAITIGSNQATPSSLNSSTDLGFAEFTTIDGTVEVSRPVMVAVTPKGGTNIQTTLELRQNGRDDLALFLYRVDSLTGVIDGIAPGDDSYMQAALARRYALAGGGTEVDGPGYGLYREAEYAGVNSGDLIAAGLLNRSTGHTFFAFSQANERVSGEVMQHLWSYGGGSGTYGFEDTFGGGDLDFNDCVFRLRFTDAAL